MNNHIRTSISGFVYQFLTIIVGLMLTPILLSNLGSYSYGIWALLSVLISYESISDIGITTALIKYVNQTDDLVEINKFISATLVVNAATTILMIVLIAIFRELLFTHLLKISPAQAPEISSAFTVVLLSMFVLVNSRSLSSVLDAFQRPDIRMNIESAGLLFWVGMICLFFITRQFGLFELVLSTLISSIIRVALLSISVLKIFPDLKFSFRIQGLTVKRLLSFGLHAQGANIGASVVEPLLRSLAALGGNPSYTAYVQIGSSIASTPNSFAFSMVANLFPALSGKDSIKDRDAIVSLFSKYLLFVLCLVLPISLFIFIFAPTIVALWLKTSEYYIILSIRLLTVAFLLRSISMIPWRLAWGMGKPQVTTRAMIIHITIFLAGSTFVYFAPIGFLDGLLVSFMIGYGSSTLYLFSKTNFVCGIKLKELTQVFKEDTIKLSLLVAGFSLIWITQIAYIEPAWLIFLIASVLLAILYILVFLIIIPGQVKQQILGGLPVKLAGRFSSKKIT